MIQAIWIITEAGQCIFSHKYIDMVIEDQLISGLLTAFDAFSNEIGFVDLQQIGGKDSQFVYGSAGKILVAALADKKDSTELVEELMNKISLNFQERFKEELAKGPFLDISAFSGFEKEIDQLLFPKIFSRGKISTVFGTIVTAALTIGALLMLQSLIVAENSAFLIFLACIPGLFIGSLIAGTRDYALFSSLIGILPVTIYFAVVIGRGTPPESSVLIIVLMIEQFLTIAILCAILGGGIIERRRLFPLMKKSEELSFR